MPFLKLLIIALLLSAAAAAQRPAGVEFAKVEQPARFAGDSLLLFFLHRFRPPDLPAGEDWANRFVVGMVVEEDGCLSRAWMEKSSGSRLLDDEVLRVVAEMPPWVPARNAGRPVRSAARLPLILDPE